MPLLDAAAIAQLDDEEITRPAFFAFLDILGDPLRVTTAGYEVTIAGSGDAELDGTYSAIDPRVVAIGDVTLKEGGSETVTASLSGMLLPDAELLEAIADQANWRGRVARLWFQIRDEAYVPQGAIAPYYTGYMNSLKIVPAPDSQVIQVSIENYLTAHRSASNRTYLNQSRYDPTDTSAAGTLAAANNARTGQGAAAGYAASGTPATRRTASDFLI